MANIILLSGLSVSALSYQYDYAAKKWSACEFKPSTLSDAEQLKDLEWFIKAAEPFSGMDINVFSETLTTLEYESKTLARA
ncbi:carbohydrate ABC transporter substrate-binding protein, partial [Pseudomonas syringae pv. tagetis]